MRKHEDLTGKKFGRLTVLYHIIQEDLFNKNSRNIARCLCECGKETEVRTDCLKSGRTKSCGCLHDETSMLNGMKNKKEIIPIDMGTHFEIEINHKGGIIRTQIDKDDFPLIKDKCLSYNTNGYIIIKQERNRILFRQQLGSFLLKNTCKFCDHIDGNILNNRKYNLRPATSQENNMNRKPKKKYKGITCNKFNKFKAAICFNDIKYHLTTQNLEINAAKIYDIGALYFFKEFARINFPEYKSIYKQILDNLPKDIIFHKYMQKHGTEILQQIEDIKQSTVNQQTEAIPSSLPVVEDKKEEILAPVEQ